MFVAHVTQEAACAVAAMLHFLAVGVEDPVVEVGAWRSRTLDQQQLVAADPEVTIGDPAHTARVELHALADGIHHYEVVADTLHFGEAQPHQSALPQRGASASVRIALITLAPKRVLLPSRSRPCRTRYRCRTGLLVKW